MVILVAAILFMAFYFETQDQMNSSTISTTMTTSTISTSSSTVPQQCTPTTCGTFGSSLGLIVPMYVNPSTPQFTSYSQEIIQLKDEYQNVPVAVIINPDSGVGVYSSAVATEVAAMQAVGIYVVGYDWTDYCQMNVPFVAGGNPYTTLADIENNMTDYAAWYHVNGVFFDGMQSGLTDGGACSGFYSSISAYAHTVGMQYTFGNPGAGTTSQYVGSVTSIFVYEGGYAPSITQFTETCTTPPGGVQTCTPNWMLNYPKSNFGYIGFNQASISLSYIQTVSQYVEWMYMTNDSGCSWDGSVPVYTSAGAYNGCASGPENPYSTLPSYLATEMQDLATVAG